MAFTFTSQMITDALEANEYSRRWNDDTWFKSSFNDMGGMTLEEAFKNLLKENNLI